MKYDIQGSALVTLSVWVSRKRFPGPLRYPYVLRSTNMALCMCPLVPTCYSPSHTLPTILQAPLFLSLHTFTPELVKDPNNYDSVCALRFGWKGNINCRFFKRPVKLEFFFSFEIVEIIITCTFCISNEKIFIFMCIYWSRIALLMITGKFPGHS